MKHEWSDRILVAGGIALLLANFVGADIACAARQRRHSIGVLEARCVEMLGAAETPAEIDSIQATCHARLRCLSAQTEEQRIERCDHGR